MSCCAAIASIKFSAQKRVWFILVYAAPIAAGRPGNFGFQVRAESTFKTQSQIRRGEHLVRASDAPQNRSFLQSEQ